MSDAASPEPRPASSIQSAGGRGSGGPPSRPILPFLIMMALLGVCGWFLVNWMVETTRLQDCVMSGRKNCAPMDPATGR